MLHQMISESLGQVLIDGQDVKRLDLASFRRFLGIVPQDRKNGQDSVCKQFI
jgi:ABC-type transport system involved in Fe-S cluster assembly fused permease/ATPase subunit